MHKLARETGVIVSYTSAEATARQLENSISPNYKWLCRQQFS